MNIASRATSRVRKANCEAMALAFGWNEGCVDGRNDCGKRDLLFGRGVEALGEDGIAGPLALEVPYGRLFTEPVGGRLWRWALPNGVEKRASVAATA